ncbi:MAG: hypothetical protein ACRCVT_07995 [Leadbetterella sp.]
MKAYQQDDIENRYLLKEAKKWYSDKWISSHQLAEINKSFPDNFQSFHWLVKIALFFMVYLGIVFFMTIGGLILRVDSKVGVGVGLFLQSMIGIAFLEFVLVKSKHKNSGIDNAVLYCSLLSMAVALYFIFDRFSSAYFLLLCIVNVVIFLRYGDVIVALASYGLINVFVFSILQELSFGATIMPFAFLLVSVLCYFLTLRFSKDIYYKDGLSFVRILSLVVLYLSVNYYVVREGNALLNDLLESKEIPLAGMFWFFTFSIPVVYLFFGLKYRKRDLIWVGLIAFGFSLFSYRSYYSLMPVEWACTLGGTILIFIIAWVMWYLREAKSGFTLKDERSEVFKDLEAIVGASQLIDVIPDAPEVKFGDGGGFSGGGSESAY